jgi:hypothetical protein
MEEISLSNNFTISLILNEAMAIFFKDNNPESVKELFWKMFQCWVTKDCTIKANLSDEEVALRLDQLNDLVTSMYLVHKAKGGMRNAQGGLSNE